MSSFAMLSGIVGGILSFVAYIPRAIKIIRDGTRSSNTWLIWTLSNLLIFLSYYNLGARNTLWVPLAYFLGSAIMTVIAYRHKTNDWTTLHKWLLTVAILCAIRWWFSSNPAIDLCFNAIIYFIGYAIIIKAKLKSKKKETWVITWSLFFAGTIFNLFALTTWTFELAAYPIMICIMNGIVFAITLRNYERQRKIMSASNDPSNDTPVSLL